MDNLVGKEFYQKSFRPGSALFFRPQLCGAPTEDSKPAYFATPAGPPNPVENLWQSTVNHTPPLGGRGVHVGRAGG